MSANINQLLYRLHWDPDNHGPRIRGVWILSSSEPTATRSMKYCDWIPWYCGHLYFLTLHRKRLSHNRRLPPPDFRPRRQVESVGDPLQHCLRIPPPVASRPHQTFLKCCWSPLDNFQFFQVQLSSFLVDVEQIILFCESFFDWRGR